MTCNVQAAKKVGGSATQMKGSFVSYKYMLVAHNVIIAKT